MLLEIPWDFGRTDVPQYWMNFVRNNKLVNDGYIGLLLRKEYNAEYKLYPRVCVKIRFKSDADMLYFIMKWS